MRRPVEFAQFTSTDFTGLLKGETIQISMDGKGRALDNIIVERLWRSVKYEEVYIKDYARGVDAHEGLTRYLRFFNEERPHQSLGYRTPSEVYFERAKKKRTESSANEERASA